MVYFPIYPIYCLIQVISGSVMLIAATTVIWKIHNSSRNQFAYVLMFFTALFGIAYIVMSLTKAFRREEELPNGTTKYFPNYYINNLAYFANMISATQAWIFAIRYWLSATVIQMAGRLTTVQKIKVLGWAIGSIYLTIQTVDLLLKLILFPGYYDENGSQQDFFLFKNRFFDTLTFW